VRLDRERDVVQGGEVGKDARDLERAREPQARALRCRQRGDVGAIETHAARVRPQVAGELADEGGLAGAVRPDHRVRLAFAHVEIDAVAGPQGAKALC
jgi:hypothetical protein